jgi:hypothetical protein
MKRERMMLLMTKYDLSIIKLDENQKSTVEANNPPVFQNETRKLLNAIVNV